MKLASEKTIARINDWENVPAMNGRYLEKDLYEKMGIVWMSPHPNRAERRRMA